MRGKRRWLFQTAGESDRDYILPRRLLAGEGEPFRERYR
jgi:hypothetical protein